MVNITDKVSTNQTNIATNTSSISTNIPSSLGTASQVLAVNSGATATEWVDAAGGSTTKISTTTVSTAVSNVGITLPTSGYTYLLLHIQGFQPASSGYDLRFYLSDDGGTTTEPIYFARGQMTSSWYQQQSSGSRLVLNQSGISNSANTQFRGFIKIHIPTVNDVTSFQWDVGYNLDSSNQNAYYTGVADLVGTGVTANFCKFEMSSGNINEGVFTLYGIA